MTQGEGLIGLLYALKGLLEAGVVWIITGAGLLGFFLLIVNYIGGKFHFPGIGIPGLGDGHHGPAGGSHGVEGKNIVWALFLLFVIFGIYSLIALTGAVFGVNSGPAGGLIIR
jgi:hypothetical protein